MPDAEGNEDVSEAIEAFKERLRSGVEPIAIVRERLVHGPSAVLDAERYAALRDRAGVSLGVSPTRDVYLVGSAKLGFSIKSSRRYQAFGDNSDVDLAVVSPDLYARLWTEGRLFRGSGGLWEKQTHFKNDHFRGVIKPYVLPDSEAVPTKRTLFDLGATLQRLEITPYPVTFAVWHSIDALEEYQALAVSQCIEELTA